MKPGRRIGFDYGDTRIGVAVTDASGLLASPIPYLLNESGNSVEKLQELFDEFSPIYIALGFPLHLSGSESAKSEIVLAFAETISTLTNKPIYLIDERMTTVSASRTLRESGKNAKNAKESIDSASAVAILESALNQERLQGEPMNRYGK